MIIKKLYLVFLCFIALINITKAESPEILIRPGLKVGYQFGENGGFVYGFELGVINYVTDLNTQKHLFGILSSLDFCNENSKLHFGLELSAGSIAFEIGPTFYYFEEEVYNGLTFGVNSLLIITPYLEYTKIFKNNQLSFLQTGAFLKVPIPFGNRSIKFH